MVARLTPGLQALISELKCRILFVGPSPRGLRQRGFQPAVPLPDLATFSLTGAAVVSWTYASPGSQMMTTGERDHCHSCPIPISARIPAGAASLLIPGT